jgi:hypothetical protein
MTLILSGTNGLSDVDGDASTPAIRGTDANTGMFFGTDIVGLSTGGSERMRINSSGNVGIGTTTPTALRTRNLEVSSGGTNDGAAVIVGKRGSGVATLRLTGLDTTVGTDINFNFPNTGDLGFFDRASSVNRMVINSSGNVGIGTTTPDYRFTVLNAGATSGVIAGFGTNSVENLLTLSYDTTSGESKFEGSVNGPTCLSAPGATSVTFKTNATERMRIDSSGNLLVGTTSTNPVGANTTGVTIAPAGFLNIQRSVGSAGSMAVGNNTAGSLITFYYTTGGIINVGGISITSTTTSYVTSSDYRLKENIAPMTGALEKVASLKPCTYTWKSDGSVGEGFIAHELQEVAPYAVSGEKDGKEMQGVDYGKITPLLTAALQEALAKIETLEARIAALETK